MLKFDTMVCFLQMIKFPAINVINLGEQLQQIQMQNPTTDFLFSRARLVFSGQVHPNVFFYFQPDFASSPSHRNPEFCSNS